ncbi:unnamed protein product, partial [Ectocarpus fasciculatus]
NHLRIRSTGLFESRVGPCRGKISCVTYAYGIPWGSRGTRTAGQRPRSRNGIPWGSRGTRTAGQRPRSRNGIPSGSRGTRTARYSARVVRNVNILRSRLSFLFCHHRRA